MAGEYPECERLVSVSKESQALGEFLDWLIQDKGIVLCNRTGNRIDNLWAPQLQSIEAILAEYFHIDLERVEEERRQILEEIRSA